MQVKDKPKDRIKALYLKTLALLAQHNVVKIKSMTAQQFAHFVDTTHPDLAANFSLISKSFTELAYQNFEEISQQERNKRLAEIQGSYRKLRWQLWLNKLSVK